MSQIGNSYVYETNDDLSGVSSQDLEDQKSVTSKEIPLYTLVKNTPTYMEFEKIESSTSSLITLPSISSSEMTSQSIISSSSEISIEEESKSSNHFIRNEFYEELEENGSILTEYSINSLVSITEAFEEEQRAIEELPKKMKKRRKKCILL